MTGITSTGIGSGLDVNGLVQQLVTAEGQAASQRLIQRETQFQSRLSAYGSLKSSLEGFKTAIDALQNNDAVRGRTISSSNEDAISLAVTSDAVPASYSIDIESLATAARLSSASFTGADAAVGSGTLDLSIGTESFSVTIDPEANTLADIRDAINNADDNAGVLATIINAESGSFLVLTGTRTGAANGVTVTQSTPDNGLSALTFDPGNGSNNLTESVAAADARATVNGFTVTSDTEFSPTYVQFFAGWPALFNEVYAAHAYGADATEVNANLPEWGNADGTLPSSGPMLFESWERGVSMNLLRNDAYHGTNSPDAVNPGAAFVDGVQINFVADTDAQINALKAGEAQIIMTQPQLAFGERLATDENFTVASEAGPVYEHWGFNLLNVHLSDPLVREAVAFGIDKTEVMAALYTPLFGDSLPAEGLGNVYWMSNQGPYVDAQAEYTGLLIDEAAANLEEAGYTLGGDGVYEHPERGRLSLRVGTTGGNALRELQQELIQAQLAESGIEIVIDNVPGAAYFGEVPFSEEALAAANSGGAEGDPTIWDITQFAWVGSPWPGSGHTAWLSGSGNNPYGYANADFDAKADECDGVVDDDARAACYNELNQYITSLTIDPNGLVAVPLTQKPSFYGYLSSQLSGAGVAPDAQGAGPLPNVVDFQFAS